MEILYKLSLFEKGRCPPNATGMHQKTCESELNISGLIRLSLQALIYFLERIVCHLGYTFIHLFLLRFKREN